GSDKVLSVIKNAQDASMVQAPAVPAPQMPAVQPAPAMPGAELSLTPESGVGEGNPADVVRNLADKLRDLSSDLGEAVDALVGEQPEMGVDMPVDVTVASDSSLESVRKQLAPALKMAMSECIANIKEHVKELDTLK